MKLNTDEVFVTDRCHAPILVAITSLSPASQPPAADRPKNMGGSGRVIEQKLIATVRRESAVVAAAMATVPENSYIFPALERSRHGLRNHQRHAGHAAHWRRGRRLDPRQKPRFVNQGFTTHLDLLPKPHLPLPHLTL